MQQLPRKVGVIILAAGASTRLKKPKQLLPFKQTTLLEYLAGQAAASAADIVVIVTGAQPIALPSSINETPLQMIENKNWREGMAASIRTGVSAMMNLGEPVAATILMPCDQPFVDTTLLDSIISEYRNTGGMIVASNYGTVMGPPVLFDASLFSELMKLKGDSGARSIIDNYTGSKSSVPFSRGIIDIDTWEDFEALQRL